MVVDFFPFIETCWFPNYHILKAASLFPQYILENIAPAYVILLSIHF